MEWEPDPSGGSFAVYEGQRIGGIAPIRAATRWSWFLHTPSSAIGDSATEAGAKRALLKAWRQETPYGAGDPSTI